MSQNKEDLKNKIIYRASYRGSKEMDALMIGFINSIINQLNYEELIELDNLVNMDDETLKSFRTKQSIINFGNHFLINLLEKFKKFNL